MLTPWDLLFPKICVGCQEEGAWLCASCLADLKPQPHLVCPDCLRPTQQAEYCPLHQPYRSLDGLVWLADFDNFILREAIHTLKYQGVREIANLLGQLLTSQLAHYPWLSAAQIVPVPLHWQRQAERGFNQAELIARSLPGEYRQLLIRSRSRPAQATLNQVERQRNLAGVFAVKERSPPAQTILLVDDVSTTGTTLDQAAAVLKLAGAKTVWGAVLGKG